MLQNLLIFALCIVAIQATGEFTILNCPKSLSFKGNEPIQSHEIGEVLYASLGNAVSGDSRWSGLTIQDPFNLPRSAFIVSLNGVERTKVSSTGKTYAVQGNTVEQALNGVITQLEEDGEPACAINFEHFEEGKRNFRNIFGDVKIHPLAKTKYLNSNLHISDKQCLESIAYLHAIAENLSSMKKTCKLMYVGLFFDDVAKSHGKESEAVSEALDLAATAVKNLNTAVQKNGSNEALVVVAVNKADGNSRSKRDAAPANAKAQFNLAMYYNEDYPVIFNIILWFMVVFGFSLLAICYAIGSMDPGRDSIIYRMTSTRMKKDN